MHSEIRRSAFETAAPASLSPLVSSSFYPLLCVLCLPLLLLPAAGRLPLGSVSRAICRRQDRAKKKKEQTKGPRTGRAGAKGGGGEQREDKGEAWRERVRSSASFARCS